MKTPTHAPMQDLQTKRDLGGQRGEQSGNQHGIDSDQARQDQPGEGGVGEGGGQAGGIGRDHSAGGQYGKPGGQQTRKDQR